MSPKRLRLATNSSVNPEGKNINLPMVTAGQAQCQLDYFGPVEADMKAHPQRHLTADLSHLDMYNEFQRLAKGDPLDPVLLDLRNRRLAKEIVGSGTDKIYITYGAAHLPGVVAELRKLNPDWRVASLRWMRAIEAPERLDGTLSLSLAGDQ